MEYGKCHFSPLYAYVSPKIMSRIKTNCSIFVLSMIALKKLLPPIIAHEERFQPKWRKRPKYFPSVRIDFTRLCLDKLVDIYEYLTVVKGNLDILFFVTETKKCGGVDEKIKVPFFTFDELKLLEKQVRQHQ